MTLSDPITTPNHHIFDFFYVAFHMFVTSRGCCLILHVVPYYITFCNGSTSSATRQLFSFWPTVLSVEPLVHYVVCLSVVCRLSVVCVVLYCGKMVRPSEKLSEGVNRKPGSKSWFFGSPPYFYFRYKLTFYSSKPCAYCRIVRSELKPEVVLATIIDLEWCK